MYSVLSLQMLIVNQQVLLASQFTKSYLDMTKFVDNLLQSFKEEFKAFIAEGRLVAKMPLQSALNVMDSSSRVMASTSTVRAS